MNTCLLSQFFFFLNRIDSTCQKIGETIIREFISDRHAFAEFERIFPTQIFTQVVSLSIHQLYVERKTILSNFSKENMLILCTTKGA